MAGRVRSLPPAMADVEERRREDGRQLHPDDQDPEASPIAVRIEAVSFHLECLLFNLPDEVFRGAPADYIPSALSAIIATSAEAAWIAGCMTPCRDRDVLSEPEWGFNRWHTFHELVKKWTAVAQEAAVTSSRPDAIALWRLLLGDAFFPETVTR